ncbi:MAG: 50S ribosomal protein L23 [Candidatus Ratteibacteria bacterium]|jgi:large subunit ribosomal protein L23
MSRYYGIVKYPLVTEKGSMLEQYGKYIFAVDPKANKYQIREAIEAIYNVKVEKVAILAPRAKKRRYRTGKEGYKSGMKKAVVTLKEGEKIAIT